MTIIKNYLAVVRKEKHITQKSLSKKTGISVRSIQYIESNKRIPNVYNALKIAKCLDCDIVDIFEVN